jgi:hypothetical protein
MVGTRGTILRGNGSSFVTVPSETDAVFFSVWGTGPDDVWIAASQAPLHSTALPDGGIGWISEKGDAWQEWLQHDGRTWAIWGTSKSDVWMAGAPSQRFGTGGASIWRTDPSREAGVVWSAESAYKQGSDATQAPIIRALGGSGPNDIWAVGMSYSGATVRGEIFHYEPPTGDQPARWTDRNSNAQASLESVWAASVSDVWAVGEGGVLRHYSGDPSQRFDIVASPTTRSLHGVWGSGPDDIWTVGDRGTVLHYDGSAWSLAESGLPEGSTPDLYGVWGAGPDDVWIAGDGVVLHRTKQSRRHP